MARTKVVVVGGGMAGLATAATLDYGGYDVILVEASDYWGGRVRQAKVFKGWPPVDIGGEFIHGCKTITYRLAEENNWETKVVYEESDKDIHEGHNRELIYLDGKMYAYNSDQGDIMAANTAFDDFTYFHNKKDNNVDMSASEYFDCHPELSPKVKHIFNTVFCQTEAANIDTYGATEQGNFEDLWPCGQGTYRLVNSYEQLVKYYLNLCKNVKKRLNWQARKIDYTDKNIKVINQSNEVFECDHVIVCVPLTVLKDNDIHFKPKLPEDKQLAIKKVQMNTGLKIVARFRRRFWPQNHAFVYNCSGDISQIWMYTNVDKETGNECHIVAGFQTADYANEKANLTDEQVKDIFLKDLDEMFGNTGNSHPATDSFVDFVYYHWSSHPYIRGAYTSPSVHALGSRAILARAVQERVFFAGEATRSEGDCCTISGALESGIQAANEVLKLAGKQRMT